MDKGGDSGIYKYSRRGDPDFSLRNPNPNQTDNNKIHQPPWKLGISSSSSGSRSNGRHNKSRQSHSSPEKPRVPMVDATKSVRGSSSRIEKQKQKQTIVGESSSSSSAGKTVSPQVEHTETDDVPDFDPLMWAQAYSSSSSSTRFLLQRNKEINLGSSSNGTGTTGTTGTGTGTLRHGGIKSVSDVIPSSVEGVRKIGNGEGTSIRARTTGGVLFARNSETEFQFRAPWADDPSQEDEIDKEEEEEEEEEEQEEEEEEEEEAQPSRFAFLLPRSSRQLSRPDSVSGSAGLDWISDSSSDSGSGLSGGTAASRYGEEESGRGSTRNRVIQRGPRLRDREAYRRDGIAEVLLALERIERNGELSYEEQLLILETNILLNGLTFHDEHRDMRMDIDNMSYEELLALEEKMGTVSTALSEEEFANCLKRSVYHKSISHSLDDVKCSVCQEEYEEGEKIGMLKCEHWYHVRCIHEWLRQKNWCPVCKAPQNDR